MTQISRASFMRFPFTLDGEDGTGTSTRADHVREVIEQVLFTNPGERVFRPEWGAGAQALVFEGNNSALWQVTQRRLEHALADATSGEVDPKSLSISVSSGAEDPGGAIGESTGEEQLVIRIGYQLTTINQSETAVFTVGAGS